MTRAALSIVQPHPLETMTDAEVVAWVDGERARRVAALTSEALAMGDDFAGKLDTLSGLHPELAVRETATRIRAVIVRELLALQEQVGLAR